MSPLTTRSIRSRASRAIAALAFAVISIFCLGVPAAGAAGFAVDSQADLPDATPGNGVCATATVPPVCTLRAAVQEANSLAGADSIGLPAGQYALGAGALQVSDALTIQGADATTTKISGAHTSQVFFVNAAPASLTMADVTVADGVSVSVGGAVQANGELSFDRVVVEGNVAETAGGGIYSNSHVTLTESTVRGNKTAALGVGGGAFINDPMTIVRSTFSGNEAELGGAIFSNGELTIVNSTLSGNRATGSGSAGGGAIWANSPTSFSNATVALNSAAVGTGGGIVANDSVSYTNTVFAANTAATSANCENRAVTVAEHSLESADSCGFTSPGSLQNTDPLLGPLLDNGGPTETMLPAANSPLIDAAEAASCPPTDQRGVPRPQLGGCDIGAVERAPAAIAEKPATGATGELPKVEMPVLCQVPQLKHKSLKAARKALAKAHCKLGKVRKPRHNRGRLVVKRQSPASQQVRAANAPVAVKLSPKPQKPHKPHGPPKKSYARPAAIATRSFPVANR